MYSLDIDIGGTFTDGFFTDGDEARTAKVLTTPHDVTEGFMECIAMGADQFGHPLKDFLRRTNVARLSTTIGTNLLVQRKGARIGLLLTKGAEEDLYSGAKAKACEVVLNPKMIVGIDEEVTTDGVVKRAPSSEAVLGAVRDLIKQGAQIIVVSFANAWASDANERAVRLMVRARYPVHYLRSVVVQLGSEIINDRDDHARTNSAVLNAYIHADMARVLFRAEDRLREAGYDRPLLIVHASGGNARIARTIALNTLHSGPAVAVKGAAILSSAMGLNHVVSADMGGTSFDIGYVIDSRADLEKKPEIESMRIATPAIRVDSIGIGGGSIAWIDDAGTLRVGPESAGSSPGPACYGKGGTEPTVTDANVVIGCIDPDYFLGGRMKLDLAAARRVIERRIARKLGSSVEQAAFAIRAKADAIMAHEISSRLAAIGMPVDRTTLFSVGGAGPLHACQIAEGAGLRGAAAFPFGSVFSAFGSSNTDIQHLYRHAFSTAPDDAALAASVARLVDHAKRDMRAEGFEAGALQAVVVLVTEDGTTEMRGPVEETGRLAYALFAEAERPVQSVDLLVEAKVPHWELRATEGNGSLIEPKGRRAIYWDQDAATQTPIFDRLDLKRGAWIEGPAMVEGNDTTYAIAKGWGLLVDEKNCFQFSRL